MVNSNMKYIVISFFLISAISAFASEPEKTKTRYYRHEISISIGGSTVRSKWSDSYEYDVKDAFGNYKRNGTNVLLYKWEHNEGLKTRNVLKTVSYYYHLDNSAAIGVLFGFCNVQYELGYPEFYELELSIGNMKKGYTDVRGTSFFLMPSFKGTWLNNSWCSLYAKVSAGVHIQNLYLDSDLIPAEQKDDYNKSHMDFAYCFTPFGWEIGKQKVRWYVEFGLGSNSNIQTGLIYRFGRY